MPKIFCIQLKSQLSEYINCYLTKLIQTVMGKYLIYMGKNLTNL